jgi:hypothetical protein
LTDLIIYQAKRKIMKSKLVKGLLLSMVILIFITADSSSARAQRIFYSTPFPALHLEPGQQATWFVDNVSFQAVRMFTAAINPNGAPIIGSNGSITKSWIPWDQKVEITNVFYIAKGENHASDGTGGQRTYQANVTVKNLNNDHPADFQLLMTEIFPK